MKIAIIGGGPAGMAAAYGAKMSCSADVVIIERNQYLGGVLPQCIHNGFGTQLYNEDYTGGEYAAIWEDKIRQIGVEVLTGTTVMNMKKGWNIKCVNALNGAINIGADVVIVATGCRERTLPQMRIPGSRPAGIFTAGSAQLMMNVKNFMPGKSAVILGSGDIGLIMARRMTLEGVNVKMILGEKSTGLARNIVQCVEDFQIPMRYGWTLVSTHGYARLKGVNIAPTDDEGKPILSKKEYIHCDTLLVATGLIPETEIFEPYKKENGIFFCGNANKVHDLVDNVTCEALKTAWKTAKSLDKKAVMPKEIEEAISFSSKETKGQAKGNMICTICPKSCIMHVDTRKFKVSGNQCDRGYDFAKQEFENPQRVVTTVVKAKNGLLSVKTQGTVDKKEILEVIKAAKKVKAKGPIKIGEVIKAGKYNLLATKNIEE